MFRVLSALSICAVLLSAGCASDVPSTRTKIVEKRRTCTIITRPIAKEEFCATSKACPLIATCGEAYYRYTTCRELPRDGGVAGEKNGVPCQNVCGTTALEMAAKIRSEPPFSTPMHSSTVCDR